MLTRFILILATSLLFACSSNEKDPTKNWSAEEFYKEAQSALYTADFESAINYLETLEARFPFDPFAKQAQLDIAYAYYKFDEPESALSAINRFVRLHPRDKHIDYAYYLKGLINFYRGTGFLDSLYDRDPSNHDAEVLSNAYNDFSKLIKRFPGSYYAGDAYQRLIFLRNKLAKREINIAEFYLERGTWMASANRAKQVIEKYQRTVWSHRALEILAASYEKLGMPALAEDARRVLTLNKKDTEEESEITEAKKIEQSPPKS